MTLACFNCNIIITNERLRESFIFTYTQCNKQTGKNIKKTTTAVNTCMYITQVKFIRYPMEEDIILNSGL